MSITACGWTPTPIRDVCEAIIDCVNKTAPTVEYETPFKMIRTTNVRGGWINLDEVRCVDADTFARWNRRATPRKGDVILTREAPLGEVGMLRGNENVFLGQRLVMYRADPEVLDNRFLLYSFQEAFLQSQIRSLGSGATVEHMRVPDAEKLTIRVPALNVQQRIADVLGGYDDLIENNTRRIKILEEMAQMTYREWFVNFRFPGHEKVRMVESESGSIPEGWSAPRLEQVLDHVIGGGWGEELQSDQFSVPAYVIRGTDIPGARQGSVANCPLRWHKESNFISRRLQAEDLVFEVSGGSKGQPVGRSLLVGRTLLSQFDRDVICASFCKLLRPKAGSSAILFCFLLDAYTNGVIEKYQVQSTGISNFKFTAFINDVRIPMPSPSVVARFKEVITPILEAVAVLGKRNSNLRTTRDFLLPKLISGEVAVEAADEVAAEFMEQTA